MTTWLAALEAGFEDRVLPFSQETALFRAAMEIRAEGHGKPMAAFDSVIAATALAYGLRLVTRNVLDFAFAGVDLLNPWDSA